MTDEHICQFDVLPEKLPDICLRSTLLNSKVSTNLNVASVKNRSIRSQLLDEGNQPWHLGVVNLVMLASIFP